MPKVVVVTGSTGLLGRAICKRLNPKFVLSKWSHSRGLDDYEKVDLLDSEAVVAALDMNKPWAIVHAAAERKPDVVSQQSEAAKKLNVTGTETLAKWAAANGAHMLYMSTDYVFDGTAPPYTPESKPNPHYIAAANGAHMLYMSTDYVFDGTAPPYAPESKPNPHYIAAANGAHMLYMSTDYVFDGTAPPYAPESKPNPLNEYGSQKLAGEAVVAKTAPKAHTILRVPILYGPVEFPGEGPVDVILKNLMDSGGAPVKMSDYERRYPTHVDDVSKAIELILNTIEKDKDPSSVQGILHWSGDEEMTKWDMCGAMGDVLSVPTKNAVKESGPSPGGATRPYNSKLDCSRLQNLGMRNDVTFRKGIECLIPCVED